MSHAERPWTTSGESHKNRCEAPVKHRHSSPHPLFAVALCFILRRCVPFSCAVLFRRYGTALASRPAKPPPPKGQPKQERRNHRSVYGTGKPNNIRKSRQAASAEPPLPPACTYLVPALQLEVALCQVQVERELHRMDLLLLFRVEVEHLGGVREGLGVARSGLAVVLTLEKLGPFLRGNKGTGGGQRRPTQG